MAYVLTEFKIGLSYSLIFASKMRKVGGRCLVNKKNVNQLQNMEWGRIKSFHCSLKNKKTKNRSLYNINSLGSFQKSVFVQWYKYQDASQDLAFTKFYQEGWDNFIWKTTLRISKICFSLYVPRFFLRNRNKMSIFQKSLWKIRYICSMIEGKMSTMCPTYYVTPKYLQYMFHPIFWKHIG